MSSKILLKFLGGCLALFIVMGISTNKADAQVVSGKTAEPSGQLMIPYDYRGFRTTGVQVTNTSIDEPVNIHVQILNAGNECRECNFFDTLTPSDTVLYDLGDIRFNGPNGARAQAPCDASGDHGVVVITPTSGLGPDAADVVVFNHLFGRALMFNDFPGSTIDYLYNAIGRDAVLPSGAKAPAGSSVDGVAASFELINPNNFHIHYDGNLDVLSGNSGDPVYADVFMVALNDDYGGGDRYSPQPGTTDVLAIDVFDEDEAFSSCDEITFTCLNIVGINNQHVASRALLSSGGSTSDNPTLLNDCKADLLAGTTPALVADDCTVLCDDEARDHDNGYTRLDSLGGGDADVSFGLLGLSVTDFGGASHIFVK